MAAAISQADSSTAVIDPSRLQKDPSLKRIERGVDPANVTSRKRVQGRITTQIATLRMDPERDTREIERSLQAINQRVELIQVFSDEPFRK